MDGIGGIDRGAILLLISWLKRPYFCYNLCIPYNNIVGGGKIKANPPDLPFLKINLKMHRVV